jgi:hypothetical protein
MASRKDNRLWIDIDDRNRLARFGQHGTESSTPASDHQRLMDRDLRKQTEKGVDIGGQTDAVGNS